MRFATAATAAIAAIGLTSGCTNTWLKHAAITQGSTLPDLQYQQVLNNLALFAVHPGALPWHINLKEGTTQVTDSLEGGVLVDLTPPATTQPTLLGSRTVVEQWGVSPVTQAVILRLLRLAYRRAHGSGEVLDPAVANELVHELKGQYPLDPDLRNESEVFFEYGSLAAKTYEHFDAENVTTLDDRVCETAWERAQADLDGSRLPRPLPRPAVSPLAREVCRNLRIIQEKLDRIHPGWFLVGRKRDVPKNACYVGHYRDRYVWVGPEGIEDLTQFTLTILDFSSLIKETQTLISPGQVKFSPGDR